MPFTREMVNSTYYVHLLKLLNFFFYLFQKKTRYIKIKSIKMQKIQQKNKFIIYKNSILLSQKIRIINKVLIRSIQEILKIEPCQPFTLQ